MYIHIYIYIDNRNLFRPCDVISVAFASYICTYVHSCQMFIPVSKTPTQFIVLRGLRL